jgi:hypothetical protein
MSQAGRKFCYEPDKEAWLRLAADWMKLAQSAGLRRRCWVRGE